MGLCPSVLVGREKPWTGRRGVNRCQVIRTVVTPVSISDGEQPLARRPGISSRPAACRVSRLVTKQRRYSRGLSSHPCLSTARTAWPTAAPLPSPRPGSLDDHRISVPLSPPRRPLPPSAKRRTTRRRRCTLPGGCRTGPLPFTSEAKQFIFVLAGLRVRPRFESRSVPARHVSSEVGEEKNKRKGRDANGHVEVSNTRTERATALPHTHTVRDVTDIRIGALGRARAAAAPTTAPPRVHAGPQLATPETYAPKPLSKTRRIISGTLRRRRGPLNLIKPGAGCC